MVVFLAICIFVAAGVFSMLGMGGGVFYTPFQVWMGYSFHEAAATSLFLIMATSLSASLVFHRAGKIDWPMALTLESVTAGGAFAGGVLAKWIPASYLSLFLAFVLAVSALFMFRRLKPHGGGHGRQGGFFAWRRTAGGQEYFLNLAVALPVSFAAGLISGMLGVGGGLIKVPAMVLLLGIPMDVAVGSSALMVGFTAAGGFAGHIITGGWDWRLSLVLAAAAFAGAQIGSRITVGISRERLRRLFAWFILLIAAAMLYHTLR